MNNLKAIKVVGLNLARVITLLHVIEVQRANDPHNNHEYCELYLNNGEVVKIKTTFDEYLNYISNSNESILEFEEYTSGFQFSVS